jgi:hypothetical protein
MHAEKFTLSSGDSVAIVDGATFGCSSLVRDGWQVLGQGGMRIEFPWVGEAARPARLRVGGHVVDIRAGALPRAAWDAVTFESDRASAHLRTAPSAAFPFELTLRAEWRLDDEGLRVRLNVANDARMHAPFGLGVRLVLAPVGDSVSLLVPAEETWPHGGGPPRGLPADLDFRRPRAVDTPVTARFTRRHFANLQNQLAVLGARREVWVNTSADFWEAEVALEPNGSGMLESATCASDAFALHAAGLPTGLRVLAPGETWAGSALLVVRART